VHMRCETTISLIIISNEKQQNYAILYFMVCSLVKLKACGTVPLKTSLKSKLVLTVND